MASLLQSRVPSCLACLRRTTSSFGDGLLFSSSQQIRGKKQLAKEKDHTITIKLIQNVIGIGRKGRMVNVPPGLMRNKLYGRKWAVYVTPTELEELGSKKNVAPPDTAFGRRKTLKPESITSTPPKKKKPLTLQRSASKPKLELDLLTPERSTAILSDLLPAYIDFFETTITLAPEPVKKISPSLSSSSARSSAASGGSSASKPTQVPIYGSVSTADIAAKIKTILLEDAQGKRIVFGPDDIRFVQETEDKDRVKHLGIFEFDIRVKGASDAVRRSIKINAQD